MTSPGERDAWAVDQRAVLDTLARAVVVTDPDGRIVLWNRASEGLYGWKEQEVLGRSVLEVLAPADDVAQNRQDLESVANGTAMTGDRLVRRRDGQAVRVNTFTAPMVDEAGGVIAIVGSTEDVGELRLAEQKTRDLFDHFRLALEAGGLGTWRWDIVSGNTVWDERLESLFGLPPGGFDGSFECTSRCSTPMTA